MLRINNSKDVLGDDKDGLDNDNNVMEHLNTTIHIEPRGQLVMLHQLGDSCPRTINDSVDSGVCDLDTPPGPSTTSSLEPPEPELISVPGRGQGHHFLGTYLPSNEDGERILHLQTLSDQQVAAFSTGDPSRKRKAEDIPQDGSPAKKRGGIRGKLTVNSRDKQDKINKSSRKSKAKKAARIKAEVLDEDLELILSKCVHDTLKLELFEREPDYPFEEFQRRPKPDELETHHRKGKRTAKDDQEKKAKKRAGNERSKRKGELKFEYDAQDRQDKKSWYSRLARGYVVYMQAFHPKFDLHKTLCEAFRLNTDASFLERASQIITKDL